MLSYVIEFAGVRGIGWETRRDVWKIILQDGRVLEDITRDYVRLLYQDMLSMDEKDRLYALAGIR